MTQQIYIIKWIIYTPSYTVYKSL